MIISIRSMSYKELKESLSTDDKIIIWSCDTCIKDCGFAGYDKMLILEKMLKRDGYQVTKKELLGVSCVPELVAERKTNPDKKQLYEEATVIIALTCEAGLDELIEAFPDKKVIKAMTTLGVGICSNERGVLLTNPFEDINLEPNPEGIHIKEAAEKLNLHATFFDEDKDVKSIEETVELTINGKKITAVKGTVLLKVCEDNGFRVPHLCYTETLGGAAACRLCMVKVKGMKGLVTSCCTYVTEGMDVTTDDEELTGYRRMVLELILASQEHDCLYCTHNNNCELQKLCREHDIDQIHLKKNHQVMPVDESSMALIHDHNKCILCGRCIRACDEIAGKHNLGFLHRGDKTIVSPGLNKTMGKSDCETCLACVFACPTGALHERMFRFFGPDWKRSKVYGYYQ